ncbi:tripartite tricarboxylate transporter TctB family protein [Faunimonas sp. B44]|uniref:tripartite tricarboxylate transporter TctB family protein n=1 Tax=Faunimonas sp. B44 TaxID=3461493 RepID=UPI004044E7A0
MQARLHRDVIAGCVLIVVGAAVAVHATLSLGLGSTFRLGPGGFPAALGVILVVFGLLLALPAFGRAGELPEIRIVPLAAVVGAVVVFALLLRSVGLAPAVAAMTLVATRADGRLSLVGSATLAVVLAMIAVGIFSIGLGFRIPIFAWRW